MKEDLEAATNLTASGNSNAAGEQPIIEKIKKLFKSAINRDSHLTIPSRIPLFIALVGLCEVLMHFFATKNVRDAFIYTPRRKCEFWRFVTYMLLHNDLIHLGLNVIIQLIVAAPLELEQGHARTAAVYIGGGLAGSFGASVFDNDSKLVGASGGIYALLISQISHVILNYKILRYVLHRLLAVLLLVLADVLYICYHVYVFNNENPHISLGAHFAGALSGFLLGCLFFEGTVKWRNKLRTITAVVVFLLIISGIFYNLLYNVNCDD